MRRLLLIGLLGVAAVPAQQVAAVRNAASNAENQPVALGGLISIYGSDLASGLQEGGTVPLSTAIGDVSVMVNNQPVPLMFVSPGQINAQLPWDAVAANAAARTANGNVSLVVRRGGTSSPAMQVQVTDSSPGIFSVQFGVGQAIAINPEGLLVAPAGSIPGLTTVPTRAGGVIVIYATGLGDVNPPIRAGSAPVFEPNPQLHSTINVPTVLIGNREATVLFSGLTPQFPGVYQLNVTVPEGVPTGNAVALQLRMGGITTTDQVTIAIQ